MTRDLTKGPILGGIFRFFVPLLASKLLQQCYNIVDGILVGRLLGVNAFSAVGCTGAINFMILGFTIGSCSGFSIPIAQSFGAKDEAALRKNAGQLVWLGSMLTAAVMLFSFFFTDDLLRLLDTPQEIFEDAYRYIFILLMGIGTSVLYNVSSFVLRALGDTRTPLCFLAISVTLNVAMDLLFIKVFHLGVSGAALATVIAQFLSGAACLVYIRLRVPILHLTAEDLRPERDRMGRIAGLGFPMGAQFAITSIGSMAVQGAVNGLGATAVAADYGSGKVGSILMTPLECFALSLATFCGQNLGSGRVDRIRSAVRSMACVAFAYCIAAFLFSFFFGTTVASLYLDSSQTELFRMLRRHLLICSASYPLLAIVYLLRHSLQSMGFSKQVMAAGGAELAGRLIAASGLVRFIGFTAICIAPGIAWLLADAILITLYRVKIKEVEARVNAKKSEKLQSV